MGNSHAGRERGCRAAGAPSHRDARKVLTDGVLDLVCSAVVAESSCYEADCVAVAMGQPTLTPVPPPKPKPAQSHWSRKWLAGVDVIIHFLERRCDCTRPHR